MENEMDNEMMSCEEVLMMLGEVANKHRDFSSFRLWEHNFSTRIPLHSIFLAYPTNFHTFHSLTRHARLLQSTQTFSA